MNGKARKRCRKKLVRIVPLQYRKFALERLLQEDAVLFCAVLLSRIQNMYIKISVKSLKNMDVRGAL